jgi:predicted membrane channel-forming protein YqfA (hemolysin III family)
VTDNTLWWIMLATAVAAATVSITASALDRRDAARPTRRQRFLMHMAGYVLMGISMLIFVLRGFLIPS